MDSTKIENALKSAMINSASTMRVTPYSVAHDWAAQTIREGSDALGGWLPYKVYRDDSCFYGIRVDPRDQLLTIQNNVV